MIDVKTTIIIIIVEHGLQHAYKGRKQKKRDYRALWIQNIKASTQEFGIKYHQFMYGLALSGCQLNRKMLSELAQTEPLSMRSVVELSNQARRKFEQVKFDAATRTEKKDPHLIPFPAFATKEHELINEHVKHQMAVVSQTMERLAHAEMLEDEVYEKKLQEFLAKTKIAEPDEDPDI